jgi:hypothetical protein
MGRSLSVVLVFTFVVLLVGAGRVLIFPGSRPGPPAVEYIPEVRIAAAAAGIAFPAPATPPAGWRATSADVSPPGTPVHLHIGFLTPGGGYVALEEEATATPAASAAFLRAELGAAPAADAPTTLIGGSAWTLRRDVRGESALSRFNGRLTTVLISSDGPARLRTLAAALG